MFDYPAWEIPYWQVYYSKEPSTAIRNEYLLTQLLTYFHQANFKDSKAKPANFAFPNLWEKEKRPKQLNELTPEEEEAMINKAFGF